MRELGLVLDCHSGDAATDEAFLTDVLVAGDAVRAAVGGGRLTIEALRAALCAEPAQPADCVCAIDLSGWEEVEGLGVATTGRRSRAMQWLADRAQHSIVRL